VTQYYVRKGVAHGDLDATVTDIMNYLGLPESVAAAPVAKSAPRSRAAPTGVKCRYLLTRGDRKGQPCDRPVTTPGDDVCKTCAKKGTGKKTTRGKPVKAPPTPFSEPSEARPEVVMSKFPGTSEIFGSEIHFIPGNSILIAAFSGAFQAIGSLNGNKRVAISATDKQWAASNSIQIHPDAGKPEPEHVGAQGSIDVKAGPAGAPGGPVVSQLPGAGMMTNGFGVSTGMMPMMPLPAGIAALTPSASIAMNGVMSQPIPVAGNMAPMSAIPSIPALTKIGEASIPNGVVSK